MNGVSGIIRRAVLLGILLYGINLNDFYFKRVKILRRYYLTLQINNNI